MEILKFKGKISLKNKILIGVGISAVIIIVATILLYVLNANAREWINIYILRREVREDDVATIKLDVDKNQSIYAFDRYITILCNGKLSLYNSYASKEVELDISISNPIYDASNNYLAIAEKNGQKLYLVSDGKVLWENKVEGNIIKVNVSRSGMVSAITTGTSYKSIIVTFDKTGKELFKTYRASTIAVDVDVSVDGTRLALAEVNTSGALIESTVNIVDIQKATTGSATDSSIYRYKADSSKLITGIKYQEKGQLICIYNDSIHMIYEEKDTVLLNFSSNTKIADIELKSHIISAEEKSTGLFSAKTDVVLKNILTGVDTIYEVDSSVKEIVCKNNISAINLGTEIHFINLNGWLEKKYTSNQEVKGIVLGSSVAGIMYRDRIKVLMF
ncbi:MAG: hypothetical protein HFJ52_01870 [Clostridia bacterium]|nr:hypothetical protein [Clostridia bacterium]